MDRVKKVTYDQRIGDYQIIGTQMESGRHTTIAFDDLGNAVRQSNGLLQTILWAERRPIMLPPKKKIIVELHSGIVAKAKALFKV